VRNSFKSRGAENRGQAFGLRFPRFASVSRHPPAPVRRDGALPAGGTPAVRGLRRREAPPAGPPPSRRL